MLDVMCKLYSILDHAVVELDRLYGLIEGYEVLLFERNGLKIKKCCRTVGGAVGLVRSRARAVKKWKLPKHRETVTDEVHHLVRHGTSSIPGSDYPRLTNPSSNFPNQSHN